MISKPMLKKSGLLIFSVCCLSLNAAAQKRTAYFMKNGGELVGNADSADFIRIVEEPEKKSSLYYVQELYKSGKKKSLGYSSTIERPKYEGQFVSFFENGRRKQFISYSGGKIVDSVYSYFPNGQLYSTVYYKQLKDSTIMSFQTCNDSTGRALVTNGNGNAVIYDDDFKYITGKGKITKGEYDGTWTGEWRGKDTLTYKEVYSNGKMISGESIDGKGNLYRYTTAEIKPAYPGGMNQFYKYIGMNIRYPEHAARQRIQGIAYVKFVILQNGEIGNVSVINDVDPGLAAEAARVVKASKGWSPGVYRGRKLDVFFVVPVSFSLSS